MQEIIVPEIRQTTSGFYRWELIYPDVFGTVTVEIFQTEQEARDRHGRIIAIEKLRKNQTNRNA